MAYGNYYGGYPYNPISGGMAGVYGQPQPNYQQQPNQPQNSLIWVSGEAGGKAYPVASGATVALWDSEAPVIYLKSADMTGMPSMKVLDYTVRESNQTGTLPIRKPDDLSNYVTKDELERRLAEIGGKKHEQSDL